jgi:hypothetical protein
MILNFLSLFLIFLSLIGWGYIFKLIFFKNEKFYNLDLFFGIFLLSTILIFLNFFIPLKYTFFPINFFGLFFAIKLFYNKNCRINLFLFSIIIFFFCFISAHNPIQIDANLYHMQTIKWISDYKISFGLVNLEERLGVNSLWHIFVSSFNISKDFQLIYLLNIIPLSVLFYEVLQNLIKTNFKLSHLFLYFSLTFILFFSLIHPYNNGQIFNHIGTPENDTAAMVAMLFSIYLILTNLENYDKKIFHLTNILIVLSILFKLSHIYLVFLILVNFYIFRKNIKINDKINFLLIFLCLFWFLRNLILSTCLIFPLTKSCFFNLKWSLPERDLIIFEMISKAFNRDTPLRNKWMDPDYAINSFDWFLPWFKTYFLETAFFYFTFIALILSVVFFVFNKFFFKVNFDNKKQLMMIYFIFIGIFPVIWLQSPEIRYAYGAFITIGCLPLAINLNFKNYYNIINLSKYFLLILPILLIFKNIQNYKLYDKKLNRAFTYEQIKFYKKINGYNVYSSTLCKDIKEICVTFSNRDYEIKKKFGYFFFKRHKEKI